VARGNKRSPDVPIAGPANGQATRQPPVTKRGIRTRKALVDAARVIFERDGFLDSRLHDITAAANISTGSFYTYFDSKEEILAAVLEEAQEEMMHPRMAHIDAKENPSALIEASNRSYFEAYARNAKLMGLLEHVAVIDPQFRKIRRERSAAFVERNARSIADLQKRGLADKELDPRMVATALSAMVSRLAYYTYVLEEESSLDALVAVSTRVWCNALKISIDAEHSLQRS
jgi:AcrR family transcriptional regulator